MIGFYIDAFLSMLTYGILIGFIVKRFAEIRKARQSGDDDGDGGIFYDHEIDPVLDLPPGVVLPSDGPMIRHLEEEYN